MINGQRVKLLASQLCKGEGAPGEVLDDAFAVACGGGADAVAPFGIGDRLVA